MINLPSRQSRAGLRRLEDSPWLLGFGIWDLALGLAALAVYAATLAPGVLPADSGEYQLTGALLGVAHPPGFALYTLLSWLSTRLLPAAPALAINALSAVSAALTLALVSRAVRVWTGVPAAGVGAAALLGAAATFWAQATTANVRMFTALAVAWALAALADYERAPSRARLAGVALALGVAVSHHGSTVFLAAVLGLYALALDWRCLRRPWPLLAGLLPFLLWLYFPLRAGAFGSPPNALTWDGFLDQILARGWAGDMLAFATPAALPDRLRVFQVVLNFQWTWPALGLLGLGAAAALLRRTRLSAVLLAALAVHVFIAITYRAPQTAEYLLPAYVLLAGLAGLGLAEAGRAPRPLRWALAGLVAAGAVWQGAAVYPAYRELARADSTRATAEALLDQAPADALLLANWHWATPLWYLQKLDGRRPDVEVRYVVPRGAAYAQNWLDEIAAALPARPVLVTNFFKAEFAASAYRFLPAGPGWEVRAGPLLEPPAGLAGAHRFDGLDFLGAAETAPLTWTAAWRAAGPPRDLNFYFHLVGPDGLLYGQQDVSHPAARSAPGEVLVDRYALTPLPETPPGVYSVTAGAYLPDGTRLAETTVAAVTVRAPAARPPTAHPGLWPVSGARLVGYDVDRSLPDSQRLYLHWQLDAAETAAVTFPEGLALSLPTGPGYLTQAVEWPADQPLPKPLTADAQSRYVDFGGELILTRAEFSPRTARPGDVVTVDLEFLAARPITRDLTVKVELTGPGWHAQTDTTPVGGGLPTLKWIPGARLRDRLTLTVPAGAAPGSAQLGLGWYDAFTQQDLPILDPRLAQLGPAAPLGQIEITDH